MIKKLVFIPVLASISFFHAGDSFKDTFIKKEDGSAHEDVDRATLPAVMITQQPSTMYVEQGPLTGKICKALLDSTGEKIEKVILRDRNDKPVRLQGGGILEEAVTVIGKAAFHFPTGKSVQDLKGSSLFTREIGFSSYCEYRKGATIISLVFQVVSALGVKTTP